MKAVFRLKKNRQYSFVYKHAKSVADSHFVLLYCKSRDDSKIGFSISKKYGKAVKRNRLRRQLKAAASEFMPNIAKGVYMIVLPRKNQPYEFKTVSSSLGYLLKKAQLLN